MHLNHRNIGLFIIVLTCSLVGFTTGLHGLGLEQTNISKDSIRIEILLEKGYEWESSNSDSAFYYYKKALLQAQKLGFITEKYKNEKKEIEILNNEKRLTDLELSKKEEELSKHRATIYLFVMIVLFTVILIILGYFSYTTRTKKEKHRLEKELLIYM